MTRLPAVPVTSLEDATLNFEHIQATTSSSTFGINVLDYGAKGDGTSDSTAAIAAAINAINTGSGNLLMFPAGTYLVTSALPTITSPINITGAVSGIVPANKAGTVLKFSAGVPGLVLGTAAQFSRIQNLYLQSASSASGTDNGIASTAHGVVLDQIVVDGFGQDGFNFDTSVSGNANNTVLRSCRAINCKRHGFYLAGFNCNVFTFAGGCDATGNAGWGYYLNGVAQCALVAPHAALNTLGAYNDTGGSNLYLMPYSEGGTGNNVTLNGTDCVWLAGHFSNPTMTVTTNKANLTLVSGQLNIPPATTSTAPAAGGAGALPATPAGYMTLMLNGTNRQIPYY